MSGPGGSSIADLTLCALIFVRPVALCIVFRVWSVVLVLYGHLFIGNLAQFCFDAFFLGCSGF